MIVRSLNWILVSALIFALAGCGGGREDGVEPGVQNSSGQIALNASVPKVTFYAASRFAEQVSFGPTPALIAEIQSKGFEKWIDDQFALPLKPIDMAPAEVIYSIGVNQQVPNEIWQYLEREFSNRAISAPDQLRNRVTWSLSQFIVAASTKGEVPGWVNWHNVLYRNAFGNYGELLYQVSVDGHMAHYLDNDQNRPKSAECQHCAPNENYARELMQLFSLGVYKLNADGTPLRDPRGRFIETYTQKDVEELARVLTGWTRNQEPQNRPQRNWGNWGKPMVPSTWAPERDSGRKVVLQKAFPANQTADKDLRDVVELLMGHDNIAPFVALRMIQHLVKSDPSPSYVARVAARFKNNGSGIAGDLKTVTKSILLDVEARRGDAPGAGANGDGKFREPFLHSMAMWRGLGCQKVPSGQGGWFILPASQVPFRQQSVFSYYAPTDRAPGSNLLAPEQRLLTSDDIRTRLSMIEWASWWDSKNNRRVWDAYIDAGCKIGDWKAAFSQSPTAFNDKLAVTYFRGAMPPVLRSNMEQLLRQANPPWDRNDATQGAMRMVAFSLTTPYFGIMK